MALVSILWQTALHNACDPTTQSGQHSAFTQVNVSKGVAHRAENPGAQYAHTVQAVLGQQVAAPPDLHADRSAAEQPTAALSRHFAVEASLQGLHQGGTTGYLPLTMIWPNPIPNI